MRIKLFEAFTFDNKVSLSNTILYRFVIEKFIEEYELTFVLRNNRLKVWDKEGKYQYFGYNPIGDVFPWEPEKNGDVISVLCFIELARYLRHYHVKNQSSGIKPMIEKASLYVIKKIYLNEKSKTIQTRRKGPKD